MTSTVTTSLTTASTLVHGTKEVQALLDILPERVRRAAVHCAQSDLVEIVLDLGRQPEIRLSCGWQTVDGNVVTEADLKGVAGHLSPFGLDNRAGISGTLHRISAIRDREGEIIGLTCRVGRAVSGTIDLVRDIVASGKSILLLGPPGVGKTTMLREMARTLAETKRVVIVDTSNEIAGDGKVPHHAVGRARRMPVPRASAQHDVMIEAVENHMPEVVVIDEIGTTAEALAARTIAERGVQLVGTAHGQTLENLMNNPTLSDLVGGIESVTLSDEEARRRGTRKTVLERKRPPTFDILIEIRERDHYAIHTDLRVTVDAILLGAEPRPEIRQRTAEGAVTVEAAVEALFGDDEDEQTTVAKGVFLYGISHVKAMNAIKALGVNATIVRRIEDADLVVALREIQRKNSSKFASVKSENVPIKIVSSNSVGQIQGVLREHFDIDDAGDDEESARIEAEEAAHRVIATGLRERLSPRNGYVRRLQHQIADAHGLDSRSRGEEPNRYVQISRAGNED